MASVEQATSNTTQGFSKDAPPEMKVEHADPFAAQRGGSTTNPFGTTEAVTGDDTDLKTVGNSHGDEWDASKTPPSRFQQRKGSIYATPNSRDGHVDRNVDRDAKYHEKLQEKGWGSKFRRGSKSSQ